MITASNRRPLQGAPRIAIGRLCSLQNGRAFKPTEWVDAGTPIIRIQNLNDSSKEFNYYAGELPERFRVRRGDVLLSWSGTPGTSFGCFRWESIDGWLNQHIFNVRLNLEIIQPDYFVLHVNAILSELIGKAHGGVGLRHITKGQLDKIELSVPSLEVQNRIVDLLSRAENIVRMRREAEEKAKEIIPALFIDMFGDPATNPKGWEDSELSNHIELVTGYPFKSQEFVPQGKTARLCRGANVLPQQMDWSDSRHWPLTRSQEFATFCLERGDIVLAMDRPWISTGLKVARISEADLPALLVQRVARIRPKPTVCASYIYAALCHPSFAAHCNAVKTETVVPHISPNDIRSYRLPIPPIFIQDRFANIVEGGVGLSRQTTQAHGLASAAFQSLLAGVFGEAG